MNHSASPRGRDGRRVVVRRGADHPQHAVAADPGPPVAQGGDEVGGEVAVHGAVGVGQQHEVVLGAVPLEEPERAAHVGESRRRPLRDVLEPGQALLEVTADQLVHAGEQAHRLDPEGPRSRHRPGHGGAAVVVRLQGEHVVLRDLNGLRNRRSISTRAAGDTSVISIRPAPALRFPVHS